MTDAGDHGTFSLFVPPDMLDLVQLGHPSEAESSFAETFRRMFPSAEGEEIEQLVDGLMLLRADLIDRGAIYHGIVSVPAGTLVDGTEDPGADWIVAAGVVKVPAIAEIDAGALFRRVLETEFTAPGTHLESFETAMGWGAGLITEVETGGPRSPSANWVTVPETMALAAVLSGAHGGEHALLVVGVALDVEQRLDLAGLVALIGSQSTFDVAADAA